MRQIVQRARATVQRKSANFVVNYSRMFLNASRTNTDAVEAPLRLGSSIVSSPIQLYREPCNNPFLARTSPYEPENWQVLEKSPESPEVDTLSETRRYRDDGQPPLCFLIFWIPISGISRLLPGQLTRRHNIRRVSIKCIGTRMN